MNLLLRSDKFNRGMRKSGKRVSQFSKTMRTAQNAVRAFGMTLGAGAVIMGFKSVIKAASDAEEVQGKFLAVFKAEAAAAESFGKTLAGAVGRSQTSIKGYLATLQDTFVPLGFARKSAREMSQTMVKLAIDLASFNNQAEPDTIRDLQSAIVGNHETMRKYGVIITQATLNQKLLAMGFKSTTKGATEQQKAMARLKIIMEGTTDAQGDALRTAGSAANQFRATAAAVQDLKEAIGRDLIPMWKDLLGAMRPVLKELRAGITGVSEPAVAAPEWSTERWVQIYERRLERAKEAAQKTRAEDLRQRAALPETIGMFGETPAYDLARRRAAAAAMDVTKIQWQLDKAREKLRAEERAAKAAKDNAQWQKQIATDAQWAAKWIADSAKSMGQTSDVAQHMREFANQIRESIRTPAERAAEYKQQIQLLVDRGFLSEWEGILAAHQRTLETQAGESVAAASAAGPGRFRELRREFISIAGLGNLNADPKLTEQKKTNARLDALIDVAKQISGTGLSITN